MDDKDKKINIIPCINCIHKTVCCLEKDLTDEIKTIENRTKKSNCLKVSYRCDHHFSHGKLNFK